MVSVRAGNDDRPRKWDFTPRRSKLPKPPKTSQSGPSVAKSHSKMTRRKRELGDELDHNPSGTRLHMPPLGETREREKGGGEVREGTD